jgi:hypothetical protein
MPNNSTEATNLSCLASTSDLDIDFRVLYMPLTAHRSNGVELVSTVQNADCLPLVGNVKVGNKR